MALFKCDSCNELRDQAVCEKCGSDTHPLDPAQAALERMATDVSRNAGIVEPLPVAKPPQPRPNRPESPPVSDEGKVISYPGPRSSASDPKSDDPQRRQPDAPPESAPRQAEVTTAEKEIRGLDEFHALLDRGVKAIVVCGGSKAGKSEIAAGYNRANNIYRGKAQNLTLRATLRTDYVLGSTLPEEVWYQIIDDKLAFLDPSGEFFNRLSADYQQRHGLPDITESDFRFVQRAVRELAGIVLVVDLTRAIDRRQTAAWRQQETDLRFVLSALRWLRWDNEARPPAMGLSVNISQRASALPRIDKPVLVLFSKADLLTQYTNQVPLDFAKRRMEILHGALMTHAHRFRYDFCNTMIHTEQGDEAIDRPCGVLLPMEWLLESRFRWLPVRLPTKWLGGGK